MQHLGFVGVGFHRGAPGFFAVVGQNHVEQSQAQVFWKIHAPCPQGSDGLIHPLVAQDDVPEETPGVGVFDHREIGEFIDLSQVVQHHPREQEVPVDIRVGPGEGVGEGQEAHHVFEKAPHIGVMVLHCSRDFPEAFPDVLLLLLEKISEQFPQVWLLDGVEIPEKGLFQLRKIRRCEGNQIPQVKGPLEPEIPNLDGLSFGLKHPPNGIDLTRGEFLHAGGKILKNVGMDLPGGVGQGEEPVGLLGALAGFQLHKGKIGIHITEGSAFQEIRDKKFAHTLILSSLPPGSSRYTCPRLRFRSDRIAGFPRNNRWNGQGLRGRPGQSGLCGSRLKRLAGFRTILSVGADTMEAFRKLLNLLPFHAYILDGEGRILATNARMAHLPIQTPEALEGKALEEVFPQEVARTLREAHRMCLESGKPARVSWEIVGKSREDVLFPLSAEGQVLVLGHETPPPCVEVFTREARERQLLNLAADYSYVLCFRGDRWVVEWLSERCREEFEGGQGFWDRVVPEDATLLKTHLGHLRAGRESVAEFRVRRRDGTVRWVRDHALALSSPEGELHVFGAALDITPLKDTEARLLRLTRLYRFLAQVNQTVLRSPEPHDFLGSICRQALDVGEFRLAWIALADQEGILRIVAHAGMEEAFLSELRKMVERPDPVCNLTAEAFRTGGIVVSLNVLEDPRTEGWREFARAAGVLSMAAIPIPQQSRVVGVLNLCSPVPGHFQEPDELDLFRTLAGDIGVALEAYEQAALRGKAERELREREEVFRTLAETTTTAIFVYQGQRFVYVNRACERITGYSREELLGMRFWEVVHPDFRELVRDRGLARQRGERVPDRYEFKILRKDGTSRWIEFTAGQIVYGGRPAAIGTAVDITERKRAEEAIRERESRLREIAEHLDEIVFLASPDFARIFYVNPAFSRIFGRPVEALQEGFGAWVEAVHPEDRARAVPGGRKGIPEDPVEYRIIRPDGEMRWLRVRVRPVENEKGEVVRVVGVAADITAYRKAQEEIQRLAFYDALTGLPNRALLMDRLRQALVQASRRGERIALLMMDLDRFKEVNETFGHDAGDRVLQEVRDRMQEVVEAGMTLARIGGDEFAVVASMEEPAQAAGLAMRLREKVGGSPFEVQDRRVWLNVDVGVAMAPEDGKTPEALLAHAEMAMYQAKQEGGGIRFYRKEMEKALTRRVEVARALHEALEQEGLSIHIQPVVDLGTGQVVGGESLLRLEDPQIGSVSPVELVEVARERGRVSAITLWVIRETARWIRRWHEEGYVLPGPLAVNITAEDLAAPDFVDRLRAVLEEEGVSTAWLALEITEGSVMEDPDQAAAVLRKLKALGMSLYLDDFGTGYSSLAYLKALPLDRVKIDRQFIRDMHEDPNDHAIVSATIAMTLSLGLQAVGEGVEHKRQAQMLRTLGCDFAQGFYFGKPVPPEAFARRWLIRPRPSD